MDLRMGSQVFLGVEIPLLWGSRAILMDGKNRLSVIDLSESDARLEILGDKPAPKTEFRPLSGDMIEILRDGVPLYSYDPANKVLSGLDLKLPECQISRNGIRVGTNRFSGNMVSGFAVGIAVSDHGIAMGAPLPSGLAKLKIQA